ncbi:hypothetical protein [Chroococcidiopsis sp. CCMEE 29]|uniref:hypothetical protein n=1 Tax=Chroococcidiopsis sp. CCMEE 29 TaxID=155894 RepID=UPI00202048C1|nr:hypothetical protein [Chroococcidiopsis sp. CCMEE 29]
MAKKYIVKLTDVERESLQALIRQGKHSARQLFRARILLLSDKGNTGSVIKLLLDV